MAPFGLTNSLDKGSKVEYNGNHYTVLKTVGFMTSLIDDNGHVVIIPTGELKKKSIYNHYEQQIAKCKQDIEAYEQKNRELELAQDVDLENRSKFARELGNYTRKYTIGDIFNDAEKHKEYSSMKSNYWDSVFSYTRNSNEVQSNLSCIQLLNESISFYRGLV